MAEVRTAAQVGGVWAVCQVSVVNRLQALEEEAEKEDGGSIATLGTVEGLADEDEEKDEPSEKEVEKWLREAAEQARDMFAEEVEEKPEEEEEKSAKKSSGKTAEPGVVGPSHEKAEEGAPLEPGGPPTRKKEAGAKRGGEIYFESAERYSDIDQSSHLGSGHSGFQRGSLGGVRRKEEMMADEDRESKEAAVHQEEGEFQEVKGRKKKRKRQWKKMELQKEDEEEATAEKMMIGEVSGKLKGEMVFQVCDVMRALAAVARIVEKGNKVVFDEESYIQNKATGKKIPMRKKGRAFVIDVVMEDGKKEEITIDSAAEESVCPEKWAEGYGIERVVEESKRLKLMGANGSDIHHYGKRKVTFDTTVF